MGFCNDLIRKPQNTTSNRMAKYFFPENVDVYLNYSNWAKLNQLRWKRETIIGVETVTSAFTLTIPCYELSANSYVWIENLHKQTINNNYPRHRESTTTTKKIVYRKNIALHKYNQMSSFISFNECSCLIKRNYAQNKAFN